MKVIDIYKLAVEKGISADLRGKERIEKLLKEKKEKFEKLSEKEKEFFDKDSLWNPYADTRILNLTENKEVKKVLVGIDIEGEEIFLAKELGVDLVISHHPLGKALAGLPEVMDLQIFVLSLYGVPINVAQNLLKERISEVARGVAPLNHQKVIDLANLLKINLMCTHTAADNLAAQYLKEIIEKENPEKVKDLLNILEEIPEMREAKKIKAGPQIFLGSKENYCGKIALTGITGGTEGAPELYEKLYQFGIGTVVEMHMSPRHHEKAKRGLINAVISGHICSDSLGMNLFLDELEKKGIEIIPCGGLIRKRRI